MTTKLLCLLIIALLVVPAVMTIRSQLQCTEAYMDRAATAFWTNDPPPALHNKVVAIVTLVTRETYVDGAVALMKSIKRFRTDPWITRFVVLTSTNISCEGRRKMEEVGYDLEFVDDILSTPVPAIFTKRDCGNGGAYSEMLGKLGLWRLTDVDVVLYIDSDIVALQNPVSALDWYRPGMLSGVLGIPLLNAGVFIVQPSMLMFHNLLHTYQHEHWVTTEENFGDQDLLAYVFNKSFQQMPRIFNATLGNHSHPHNVFIHFNGKCKPWNTASWSCRAQLFLTDLIGSTKTSEWHRVATGADECSLAIQSNTKKGR
jgi:hypothetical protein